MVTAVIVDDEQHCSDRLAGLIGKCCAGKICVIGIFDNYDSAREGLLRLRPELIFMDVQLHDRTGFELLKSLDDMEFATIFTTAYERFAIQAFKFSAIDFLLKPIDPEELTAAVTRLGQRVKDSTGKPHFQNLLYNLNRQHGRRLALPVLNGLEFVTVEDIVRCQSDKNYTTFYTKDKMVFTVSKTLKEYEEILTDGSFYRVHNSHLINLNYIKSYNRGKGGSIIMTDNTEIEVSTRRKDGFLRRVQEMAG